MICQNCGYESLDSEFIDFDGCPACAADLEGMPTDGIPRVFFSPVEGTPQWVKDNWLRRKGGV
jgi:hypothetical protein